MQIKQRYSNIELLRIVAMVMIVVHHVFVHGILPVSADNTAIKLLDCLVIYGVNIFVMISGYFGIRISWKSFFKLMWIIGFYKLFHLCVDTWVLGINHSIVEWIAKPLSGPVSGGGWFVDIYVLLMFVSPLLNRIKESIKTRKDYLQCLLPLVLLDCGYGFLLGSHFDAYGYSLLHFITLYFVGIGIRCYLHMSQITMGGAVVVLLCIGVISSLKIAHAPYSIIMSSYSSPIVMFISAYVFVLFANTRPFVNKAVNSIASSMFPVYLIHDGGNVGHVFYGTIGSWWQLYGITTFLGYTVMLILGLFTMAVFIDQLRKVLAPYVVNFLCGIEKQAENLFYRK